VLGCLGGITVVVESATYPRAVAAHPVRAQATVTQAYINGPGGDPGVDYEYRARGHMFTGSGTGKLGHEDLASLRPGDTVAIEYAAGQPSQSCTCDATGEAPPSVPSSVLIAAVLTIPLALLVGRGVPRWRRTRGEWFVPVHGIGEWVGFIGGVVVGALALFYFIGIAALH
jgi:hypothetical protein